MITARSSVRPQGGSQSMPNRRSPGPKRHGRSCAPGGRSSGQGRGAGGASSDAASGGVVSGSQARIWLRHSSGKRLVCELVIKASNCLNCACVTSRSSRARHSPTSASVDLDGAGSRINTERLLRGTFCEPNPLAVGCRRSTAEIAARVADDSTRPLASILLSLLAVPSAGVPAGGAERRAKALTSRT